MNNQEKSAICIIGMHRSGTSMVTRLLSECGLELGSSEDIYLASLDDNPDGHFEHKGFHKINEKLLTHLNGAWDNPPVLKDDWEYNPELSKITKKAKALLKTFDQHPRWGWKDPRTTLLLPFWKSLISNLRFVICVRNPLEVARSLAKRDRIPIQSGVYLWSQYMRAALRDTAGYPRLITFYEDYFRQSPSEIKRVVEFCGLSLPSDLTQVTDLVSTSLKHHSVDVLSLLSNDKVLNEPKQFYLGLRALTSSGSLDTSPNSADEALLSASLIELLKLFDQAPDEQAELINNLQAQLQQQQHAARTWREQSAELESMRQTIADVKKSLGEQTAEVERQAQRVQEATSQKNQLLAEREEMRPAIVDLEKSLGEQTAEVERQAQRVQEVTNQKEQLLAEQKKMGQAIVDLEKSLGEQTAEVERQAQRMQEAIGQKNQLLAEREAMNQELAQMHNTLQERQSEIEQQARQVTNSEKEVSRLKSEHDAMRQQIVSLQQAVQQKQSKITQLQTERDDLRRKSKVHQATLYQQEGELKSLEVSHSDSRREIDAIFASRGGKVLASYWQLADRFAPLGSRRRKTTEFMGQVPTLLKWQNVGSFLKQVRLYGVKATYLGTQDKIADALNGQIDIIQTKPALLKDDYGYLSTTEATVSVVVPVKNAGSQFRALLSGLGDQKGLRDVELIVVDSGSTDTSLEIAREFKAKILQMPPAEFSHSQARNIGAEQATGDYLLFTVQDALPPSATWLAELLQVMQTEDVVAVSCAEKPRDDADLFYKASEWQYSRFMGIDKHDRILRRPERENYLTLRKNGGISNVACLVSRDTFLQYKFRGSYAEDLDLGLRLIRDGHQLALLGSTRVIHSHSREPYAHLKRGYIDELTLAEILPDRPVLETDVRQLFSDLVFMYEVVRSISVEISKQITPPCKTKEVSTTVLKKFRAASKASYPNQLDIKDNHYLDEAFKSFMQLVFEYYQRDGFITTSYNGTLLEKVIAYTKLIIEYMNDNYDMVETTTLEDFTHSLYKAYAFLSGTYLAACYKNDASNSAKATLAELHELLTTQADQASLFAAKTASVTQQDVFSKNPGSQINGLSANGQSPRITVTSDSSVTQQTQPQQHRARLIALYLPQFHPIPENDEWWGQGFTEWTNVTKAKPLFEGHYQPHLPADLGFYDLRLPEVRLAQANLARQYGIEGFCYYHYWFKGQRLIERPFNEVLASGQPDFPFCLAWANETWSRRWLGEEKSILIKQEYSAEDDLKHARWLVNVLADPRNIRVQGRPLYLIYRPAHMPDAQRCTDVLRETCVKHGLPNPYLLGINAHAPDVDYRKLGFDGTMNFEPWLGALPDVMNDNLSEAKLARNLKFGVASKKLKIYDYVEARQKMLNYKKKHPVYPTIFVSWDNSPRRGENGVVMVNSTPENFAAGLADMVDSVQHKPFDDRLVFVNAWNEWAEGNHLEPDQENGLSYLEAVQRVNIVA